MAGCPNENWLLVMTTTETDPAFYNVTARESDIIT